MCEVMISIVSRRGRPVSPSHLVNRKACVHLLHLLNNGVITSSVGGSSENGSSVESRCLDQRFLQGLEFPTVHRECGPHQRCVEPCTLSCVEMEKNNLQLKWDFDNRPYIFHGEYTEFLCRRETSVA